MSSVTLQYAKNGPGFINSESGRGQKDNLIQLLNFIEKKTKAQKCKMSVTGPHMRYYAITFFSLPCNLAHSLLCSNAIIVLYIIRKLKISRICLFISLALLSWTISQSDLDVENGIYFYTFFLT